MFTPGHLTKDQVDELHETLRSSHAYYATAQLRDRNTGHPIHDLAVLDGQVDTKGKGRSATFTVPDVHRGLDRFIGKDAAHFMAQIFYVVQGLSWGSEPVPVIAGPLDTCTRSGPDVTFTLRGKGELFSHAIGKPLTIPVGTKRTDAMRRILVAMGERPGLLNIGDRPRTLGKDLVLSATANGWHHVLLLADSLDMLAFYDADWRFQARAYPDAPTTPPMRTGFHNRPAWLITEPVESVDTSRIVNREIFHYKDKKTDPIVVELPSQNKLSAESLKHGDVLQWYDDVHVNYSVNSKAHAEALAKSRLARFQREAVHVQAECFPFPFLEPADIVEFSSRDYAGHSTVPESSLPLSFGQTMTLGWTDVRTNW